MPISFSGVKQKIQDIIAPLSARERMVISLIMISGVIFLFSQNLLASNGDVGSLFRIPAKQCSAGDAWYSAEQVSGLPSVESGQPKTDFNSSNSAGWNGAPGYLNCIGFEEKDDHVRSKSSLGFSIAISSSSEGSTAESNQSTTPQEEQDTSSGISLNQASTDPVRIDERPEPVNPNQYGQDNDVSLEGLLLISVSNDSGATWTPLHTIDSSLLSSTDKTQVAVALPDSFSDDLDTFAVQIEPVAASADTLQIWVDSIFVDYEVAEAQDIEMSILDSEGNQMEGPVPLIEPTNQVQVELSSKDPNNGVWQGISNRVNSVVTSDEEPKAIVKTEIVNSGGAVVSQQDSQPEYQGKQLSSDDVWILKADLPVDLQPGKYTLTAKITDELGGTQSISQDFYWGVLAINSDKTIYRPDETAKFAITTLDEAGATVCDGNLSLTVSGPGQEAKYSTDDNSIQKSSNCEVYSEDFTPDYQLSHKLAGDGVYTLKLKAITENGEFEISTTVEVRSNQAAYVTRTGPTRVYPPVEYPMKLEIKAEQAFSGTVEEVIPSSYELIQETDFATQYDSAEIKNSLQYIRWDVDLEAGETITLGYNFKVPAISPAFYLLGPAKITSGEDIIFEEIRQWQIAGDAIGDIAIYREATGTETVGTALTNQAFDTTVSQGGGFSIGGGRDSVTLTDGGHYFVSYNLAFATLAGTNRSEINSLIDVNGTNIAQGRSSCYIRRTGGVNNCWLSGSAIIEATAGNTVTIEAQRTDSNTATVQRRANESGLTIIKLDDSWDYARIREAGGGQTLNSATYTTIDWDTNDELDSGSFSRTGGDITLASAGHYLVTSNVKHRSSSATGTRNNATRLTLDGTELPGTRTTAYTMGTNSAQDSVSVYSGIIQTSSANQVLRLQGACENETCNSITNVGGETGITIVKLPDTADYIRLHEAGGGQAVDGTNAVVTWDTQSEVDGSSFSHNTGANSERLVAEQDGNYLFLTSFYESRTLLTSTVRLQPHWQFRDNGTLQQYGSSASYSRGDNTTQGSFTSGNSSTFLTTLSDNDYVEVVNTDRSTGTVASATFAANRYAIQGVRIQSLFPSLGPETVQKHFRWRDDTTALNTSGGWLAPEDTAANVNPQFGNKIRLRIEVANQGSSAETAARSYELQFGDATSLPGCSSISTWTGVGDASDEFDMSATTNITADGQATTPGLLANAEALTYVNGVAQESSDTTGSIGPMMMKRYTELEYSLIITGSAVTGHNYCFRVYDTANAEVLDAYDAFPEILVSSVDSDISSGLGESGTFNSLADGGWSTVNFEGSYTTPVVVGTTNSHNGESALVFESRNVTSTSAEMRICESQGGTSTGCDAHASETVGYIVVDADKVDDFDGIEAGTFDVGGGIDSVTSSPTYSESFATTPYVFGSTMTVNGDAPIEFRVQSTSTSGFTAGICQQDSENTCNNSHPTETVGWIAIEPGNSPINNTNETGLQSLNNSTWTPQTFTETYSEPPVIIVEAQDIGGGQDSVIDEARNITTTGFDVRFCELDFLDDCDNHGFEDMAWFAVESGEFTRTGNFDLDTFRFYDNENAVQPVDALAAENTALTNVADRDILRIRTAVQSGGATVNADSFALKLQYAQSASCSSAGSWTDVGSSGSNAIWRGYDNSTPNNGSAISSNLLTGSDATQSYVEQNNSPRNPNPINDGDSGEWDWVVQNNGAVSGLPYCFRVVTDDNQPIYYSVYPQVTTMSLPTSMYIERDSVYTPTVSGSWTDLDLSTYNIPRNRVVEIAIGNINTAAGLNAGVRANGSTIERRMEIIESEGGTASNEGSNYLVMHVQADDDAVIEYYASTAADARINVLGFWEDGSFTEAFNVITPGVDNVWTDVNLSDAPDNVPFNRVVEVIGGNGELATENEVGIRRNGSALNRFVDVNEAEAPATAYTTWTSFVQADAGSVIELRGEDVSEMVFYNAGYWNVMPGQFTEQISNMTNPTASNTWQNRDLTAAPSNLPDRAVAEVVLQNGSTGNENFMGSRSNGIGLNRQYDVMEAEAGGRVPLRMHTPTDGNAQVELIHQLFTQTPFEYSIYGYWVPNTAPNTPASLSQTKVDDTAITTGNWINATTLELKASLSDSNNYEALALCVEAQPIAVIFTQTNTTCSGQYAYNGSAVNAVATVTLADQAEYHWQARVRDVASDYSGWSSYGGNSESDRDFGIDTTAPSGGSVFDGPTNGIDVEFNDGSLSVLNGSWENIDSGISGLTGYDYSIGTSPGSTNVQSWTANGTGTDFDTSGLNLNTTQPYYINVRTTDNASNQSVISSDGIFVAPTLEFSTSPAEVDIGDLNAGNNFTNQAETTLTTSTNAYNGYLIKGYAEGLLESQNGDTISMFTGGDYSNPDEWRPGDTGYGYHSSDTLVNGQNRFNSGTCPGGGSPPCFAAWSQTFPGDIIADHTSTVSGTPITDEQFIITHRVTAANGQASGQYRTVIIYGITARY
jgi:hypothetical protein